MNQPTTGQPIHQQTHGRDTRVLHWYDFLCPFCYVGQQRDEILKANGMAVVDQPFRAHLEIPPEGKAVGPRHGPMYDFLEAEASRAGLPLRWPNRLPDTRLALGVAEWVRVHRPASSDALRVNLFAAHFALGEDIGDPNVVARYATEAGVTPADLQDAVTSGATDALLLASESEGRRLGVAGTPAWLIGGRMVSGLQPPETFERLARANTD